MQRDLSAIKTIFLLAAILALAGCSPQSGARNAPTVDSQVFTSTVAALQTEAAQTVYAALTQAAALTPSATLPPPPTAAPQASDTPLPTAAPTRAPIPPTATPTISLTRFPTLTPLPVPYQCAITALKPAYDISLTRGVDFDLNVTFKNTGTDVWGHNDVDFRYLSGAKFQQKVSALDLPQNVDPGHSINLVVDMVANTGTGIQTATWGLVHSGASFCYVGIRVVVK